MFFIIYTVADNTTQNKKIDEDLILKLGNGSVEALENLYNSTERILYSYALSLVGNHHDANDIVSDTYIKVCSAAHLYKPMGKPLAWIFTIERNLAYDLIKKKNKDTAILNYDNVISYNNLTGCEDKIVLNTALSILAPEERSIIMLHAVSGLKHREIASSLELPISTVLSKYHRGLKKLKNYLRKGGVVNE